MQTVMHLHAIMQPCWLLVLGKAQATDRRSHVHSRSASSDVSPASYKSGTPRTGNLAHGRAFGLSFSASCISFMSLTMRATFLSLG